MRCGFAGGSGALGAMAAATKSTTPRRRSSRCRATASSLSERPGTVTQHAPGTPEWRTSVRGMETVIVGANSSETAAKAVERAGMVAAKLGARLVVVTAYGTDDIGEIDVGSDTYVVSIAQEANAFAEQTAARLGTEYGILARGVAAKGNPERVILDAAKQFDASVIFVGNVRMQGPGRLLGSVANHIAHHAPCDVYIVKTA